MKLFSVLLPILSASLVASTSFPSFGSEQAPLESNNNALQVPGKNPLRYCAPPSNFILDITSIDLDPNPPLKGKNLNITASGVLNQDVEAGAWVALTVKYGLITLIKRTVDLCEQIENVDLKCPLKAGQMSMNHVVEIPAQVPPGTYTVIADALTDDDVPITCLESEVHF